VHASLRKVGGIRDLVRFGGHIPHLEESVISEFRRRQTPDGHIRVRPPSAEMRRDEPVAITGGLFAGCEGLFSRYLNAPERVSILLDLLHNQARVSVPAAHVKPLMRAS
jgi:transcription antitermination factor NusG